MNKEVLTQISDVFERLKSFVEKEDYKGWDPFDGLNSQIFNKLPVKNSRFIRLAWLQAFKISPINMRPLLHVPKQHNNKGLGLFLTGYCNMYKGGNDDYIIKNLISILKNAVSEGYSGACWGYNFDWQARAFFQPKGTPTVVATSFIANALLDAYDRIGNDELVELARSSCDFILNDLNKTFDSDNNYCFSYSPLDKTSVFNASLLGSRLLARTYHYTNEVQLLESALKSVKYTINHQQADGRWAYGTLPFHQWVDNFHTGYNLESIYEYQKYSGDLSFKDNIERGLDYYLNTFFTEEGIPKYYNNSIFPIDVHAPAQLIVTLYRMNQLRNYKPLVDRVLEWTINNMWDKRGFFYYQKRSNWTSKIPYMRWAQAWMFYGLSYYIKEFSEYE
ncbi:hypothetical protein [Carboxylicivirga marina]|uniref:Delta-aminolevulinic acid dehydratase n=1 Tax=Carboxylicivirga marina TaxID=2800988 RepID=A0ABS1HK13_9BACT|nr:hypothetical protein [Carboxylicivirga marina]MBK3518016.1 hypothetical protein [Carboxylicivirga marina]